MTRGKVALAFVVCAVAGLGGGIQAAGAAGAGLLGQWRFDELAGQSAFDDGPYGLDGRLGSADLEDAADPARIPGASGGALRFDGASFVRLPDQSPELAVPTLTVEAVVAASTGPGPYRYLVSRGGHGCFAGAYGLYTAAAGGIALYVFDGSRYVVSATARPSDVWDGNWHHVAGTFDGRALRLYVDGRPVGDAADTRIEIDYRSTSSSTYFGRYVGTCDLSFHGDIDLVRLWSGALSPDEVASAAAAAVPGLGAQGSSPLEAAAPPTIIGAAAAAAGSGPPASAPGAPARACVLRLSRKRAAVNRRTVVRVKLARRGRAVRRARVVARRTGRTRIISSARTSAKGRVRLVFKLRRPGRVRISAPRHVSCSPAYLRVSRSR